MRISEPVFLHREMRVVLWLLVGFLVIQLVAIVLSFSDPTFPLIQARAETPGVAEAQPIDAGG
jgi:hypothetical protein